MVGGPRLPLSQTDCAWARDDDDWACDCDCACSAAAGSPSSTQVSFVPPPWLELTTSDPAWSATRVRPPGTICTACPDSTKGRRSMWRGATPVSTKVGQVDSESVGC